MKTQPEFDAAKGDDGATTSATRDRRGQVLRKRFTRAGLIFISVALGILASASTAPAAFAGGGMWSG